jgi:VWFA-related protein
MTAHRLRLATAAWVLPGAFGLAAVGVSGQEPPPEAATPVFRAGTDVVTLDVVVRDKKGRTVRDLRPGEVEVFEDGVEQQVVSFRLEAAGDEELPSEVTAQVERALGSLGTSPAPRHFNLVTLVFDQLGVDGRLIARKAAQELLGLADRPDLVLSIFQVRESLRLVQQFTPDREVLRSAVFEATGQTATQYSRATERLEEATREAEESRRRFESAAAAGSAAQGATLAALGRAADMDRMAVDALRLTESLQREQQGHSSLYAILALARQQQRLAGRKTILFFSEGLQVPPALEHVLQAAVSEANRANVSVYAVDVRGLRAERRMDQARETVNQAAVASQRAMTSRSGAPVTREEALAGETAMAALRMDVQGALQGLAEGTGGLLIADSNDVRKGIARAVGDLRGYYELVYEPTRKEYDGRFRRIEVKVARPNVVVQARSGYFAIPPGEGTATFAYEVDLLRALRAAPAPEEFPIRTGAFRFGPEPEGVRYTAVVEVPLADIAFEGDGRGDTDRAHFSMMTVVRDTTGAVVEKFSEDSPVFLPRAQRDALKQGNAVFTRSFRIAPGRYTLEAAVVDQVGRRRSVKRASLQVARPLTRVSLSDLAIVRRTEAVPKGALPSEDPFRLGESRIVPFLTEPRLDAPEMLSVYLVAYPKGDSPRPELLLELVNGSTILVQSLLELPPPDASGRIPYVASLPVKDLRPGRYEVRALFKQGGASVGASTHFSVEGRAGRIDEAIAGYEKVASAAPDLAEVHHNLGLALGKKGDKARAEAEFRRATELKPGLADAHRALSVLLYEAGKRDEALAEAAKAAEADPRSATLQYNLGVMHANAGQGAEARAALLRAEELDPVNAEVQFQLGTVAIAANQIAEAVARLEKCVAMAPQGPNAAAAKAMVAALKK